MKGLPHTFTKLNPNNPLHRLMTYKKVGQRDTDDLILPALVHFDACHRNQGTADSANLLLWHLLVTLHIAAKAENQALYALGEITWDTLRKACERGLPLAFTTGEYQSLRDWLKQYQQVLPTITVKLMHYAATQASIGLKTMAQDVA